MYSLDLNMYFKVYGADMWGGGIGYCAGSFKDIYPLKNTHEEFEQAVLRARMRFSVKLGVSIEQVESITRIEYEKQSGELMSKQEFNIEDESEE